MKSYKLIFISLLIFVSVSPKSLAQEEEDILIYLPAILAGGAHKAVCGNSIIEAGEDCDDGNTVPGDGCDKVDNRYD